LLDRGRALMARAATDPVVTEAREPIAIELEGIIERIRQLANTRHGDNYVFGGTRLDAPPYDANGVPAATATAEVTVQVEPEGTLIASGVTAESFLADATDNIINVLRTTAAAIRGTGDPTLDRATILATVDRLPGFSDLANQARTKLGERLNHANEISERLTQYNLSLEESAQHIEAVDVAEAALALTESNNALEAILQSASKLGRRSLLDFLG
jgi:flagellar hook-associated protein 3 FlgL